ncbi:unnamed protein product [Amoebophrya sp. A120]|nr:unnamed protein product [Amoebophrya sp. A120]|eukprot:GSA120T00021262001.1
MMYRRTFRVATSCAALLAVTTNLIDARKVRFTKLRPVRGRRGRESQGPGGDLGAYPGEVGADDGNPDAGGYPGDVDAGAYDPSTQPPRSPDGRGVDNVDGYNSGPNPDDPNGPGDFQDDDGAVGGGQQPGPQQKRRKKMGGGDGRVRPGDGQVAPAPDGGYGGEDMNGGYSDGDADNYNQGDDVPPGQQQPGGFGDQQNNDGDDPDMMPDNGYDPRSGGRGKKEKHTGQKMKRALQQKDGQDGDHQKSAKNPRRGGGLGATAPPFGDEDGNDNATPDAGAGRALTSSKGPLGGDDFGKTGDGALYGGPGDDFGRRGRRGTNDHWRDPRANAVGESAKEQRDALDATKDLNQSQNLKDVYDKMKTDKMSASPIPVFFSVTNANQLPQLGDCRNLIKGNDEEPFRPGFTQKAVDRWFMEYKYNIKPQNTVPSRGPIPGRGYGAQQQDGNLGDDDQSNFSDDQSNFSDDQSNFGDDQSDHGDGPGGQQDDMQNDDTGDGDDGNMGGGEGNRGFLQQRGPGGGMGNNKMGDLGNMNMFPGRRRPAMPSQYFPGFMEDNWRRMYDLQRQASLQTRMSLAEQMNVSVVQSVSDAAQAISGNLSGTVGSSSAANFSAGGALSTSDEEKKSSLNVVFQWYQSVKASQFRPDNWEKEDLIGGRTNCTHYVSQVVFGSMATGLATITMSSTTKSQKAKLEMAAGMLGAGSGQQQHHAGHGDGYGEDDEQDEDEPSDEEGSSQGGEHAGGSKSGMKGEAGITAQNSNTNTNQNMQVKMFTRGASKLSHPILMSKAEEVNAVFQDLRDTIGELGVKGAVPIAYVLSPLFATIGPKAADQTDLKNRVELTAYTDADAKLSAALNAAGLDVQDFVTYLKNDLHKKEQSGAYAGHPEAGQLIQHMMDEADLVLNEISSLTSELKYGGNVQETEDRYRSKRERIARCKADPATWSQVITMQNAHDPTNEEIEAEAEGRPNPPVKQKVERTGKLLQDIVTGAKTQVLSWPALADKVSEELQQLVNGSCGDKLYNTCPPAAMGLTQINQKAVYALAKSATDENPLLKALEAETEQASTILHTYKTLTVPDLKRLVAALSHQAQQDLKTVAIACNNAKDDEKKAVEGDDNPLRNFPVKVQESMVKLLAAIEDTGVAHGVDPADEHHDDGKSKPEDHEPEHQPESAHGKEPEPEQKPEDHEHHEDKAATQQKKEK